jgi:hypothetical protein
MLMLKLTVPVANSVIGNLKFYAELGVTILLAMRRHCQYRLGFS